MALVALLLAEAEESEQAAAAYKTGLVVVAAVEAEVVAEAMELVVEWQTEAVRRFRLAVAVAREPEAAAVRTAAQAVAFAAVQRVAAEVLLAQRAVVSV